MKSPWQRVRLALRAIPPGARKPLVAVGGGSVLLVGLAMVLLPGPAIVIIPVGLAILATEFAWARRWLRKGRQMTNQACRRLKWISGKPERSTALPVKKHSA